MRLSASASLQHWVGQGTGYDLSYLQMIIDGEQLGRDRGPFHTIWAVVLARHEVHANAGSKAIRVNT